MNTSSWGLALLLMHIPTVFSLVMLVAAGILYSRTRTRATAAFFLGMVAATIIPWLISFSRDLILIRGLLSTVAAATQSLGFLCYVLTLPKQATRN